VGKKGKARSGKDRGRKHRERASTPLPPSGTDEPWAAAPTGEAGEDGNDPGLDPHELARRLSSLGLHLVREAAAGEERDGLTTARLSALGLLVLGGPRRLGELAAAERVRPPTMTRLVRALEAEGLVTRERGGVDGRSVVVSATEAGGGAFQAALSGHAGALAARFGRLSVPARRSLESAAGILEQVLREPSASDAPPESAGTDADASRRA
jgi:DNA-binding MarR family transcriptional regulator